MRFHAVDQGVPFPMVDGGYLVHQEDWNDWWEYSTKYLLYLVIDGKLHDVGSLKIGEAELAPGRPGSPRARPSLPAEFDALSERHFSLGTTIHYYEALAERHPSLRSHILHSLNDLALNGELFQKVQVHNVVTRSLLRDVSAEDVAGPWRWIALGNAAERRFGFVYSYAETESTPLSFSVDPRSMPPNNIHVLIGRNGVGKTYTLQQMGLAEQDVPGTGLFEHTDGSRFSSLVQIAFSAFDPFVPPAAEGDGQSARRYTYVGLKSAAASGRQSGEMALESQADQFAGSLLECRAGLRRELLLEALATLESDPQFRARGVADILGNVLDTVHDIRANALELFSRLSSGHRIVLLIVTTLVDRVENQTLVLLDEPETHLHPPLLAALTRAISALLARRNGLAIVATHSPVVLQEVPADCVWVLNGNGRQIVARRPSAETFAENVGALTREVFGLEVSDSGFHALLRAAVDEGADFDKIVQRFRGRLGMEGRMVLGALLANRRHQ